MTTLIKNGTIITATDMYKADVLVKNGIVSEIGREISKIASESLTRQTNGFCLAQWMFIPIWMRSAME